MGTVYHASCSLSSGLFGVAFLTWTTAGWATALEDPAARCETTKLKATAAYTSGVLQCYVKAAKAGTIVDTSCADDRRVKLTRELAKADVAGGRACASTGDSSSVAALVNTLASGAQETTLPALTRSLCAALQLSATAKRVRGELLAMASVRISGPSSRIAKKLASLAVAFPKNLNKAERKGDCGSTGIEATLDTLANVFIQESVSRLAGCAPVSEDMFRTKAFGPWKDALEQATALGYPSLTTATLCPSPSTETPTRVVYAFADFAGTGPFETLGLVAAVKSDLAMLRYTKSSGEAGFVGAGGGMQLVPTLVALDESAEPLPVSVSMGRAVGGCGDAFCTDKYKEFVKCVAQDAALLSAPPSCLACVGGNRYACDTCVGFFGVFLFGSGPQPCLYEGADCQPCEPNLCHLGGECVSIGVCRPFSRNEGNQCDKAGDEFPRCVSSVMEEETFCFGGRCHSDGHPSPCSSAEQCAGEPGGAGTGCQLAPTTTLPTTTITTTTVTTTTLPGAGGICTLSPLQCAAGSSCFTNLSGGPGQIGDQCDDCADGCLAVQFCSVSQGTCPVPDPSCSGWDVQCPSGYSATFHCPVGPPDQFGNTAYCAICECVPG